MLKMSALLRFHFQYNTEGKTFDEIAKAWGQLKYALEYEYKRSPYT